MNANTMHLKELNKDAVRQVFRQGGRQTKSRIAELTGLSIASCGNILAELLESGEISETDPAESTGGRPSRRFRCNFDFAHIAAVYLRKEGASNRLYSSVFNLAGETVIEEHHELPDIFFSDIQSVLSRYRKEVPTLRSVSIGIPGVVCNGEIGICDFSGLVEIPLAARLEENLGIFVSVENDVNLAALGHHFGNTGTDTGISVCLYYPKGGNPGAGIIIDGRILRGQSHFAGEVSFLPPGVPPDRQDSLDASRDLFTGTVSRTIQSLISIINPRQLILIGLALTDDMVARIRDAVAQAIPEPHIPEFLFEPDIHPRLVAGLKHLAMAELNCGFRLISTRNPSPGDE